jgi:hypothetical protein
LLSMRSAYEARASARRAPHPAGTGRAKQRGQAEAGQPALALQRELLSSPPRCSPRSMRSAYAARASARRARWHPAGPGEAARPMTGRTDTVSSFSGSDPNTRTPSPRMWNAAWRQHRYWVVGTVALVVTGGLALAVIVLLIPACASTSWWETPGATCNLEPAHTLWRLYQIALATLPVLSGAVLGAVTFGSDKEHRTNVYALTQGVSRIHWWTTKIVTVAAPVFIAAALLGGATLWVVDAASNSSIVWAPRLLSPNFDILGLIPATRFLVAYAAGAAGALIWRTVGGIVTGVVVAGVVIAGTTLLQPLVVPHTRELIPIQTWWTDVTAFSYSGPDTAYNWSGYADAEGRDVDVSLPDCADAEFTGCLQKAGVVTRVEMYVSDAEYPQMMLIISGLNLIIAGGLLAAGAQALRRRDL